MAKSTRTRLSNKQHLRRRWLTWLRMVRYGVNNFSRNAWLTTAATAVMTITLLIVFTTLTSRMMLTDTVQHLRENINLSIYLKSDISDKDAKNLQKRLEQLPNVRRVNYITSDEGRKKYIEENITPGDVEQLQTLSDSGVQLPAKLEVNVDDPSKVSNIDSLVKNDRDFQRNLSPDVDTQLDQTKRGAISEISNWGKTAERVGIVATIVFVTISTLIIFNTIRMAIFNRKEEIQMMKLIGADKRFIRGPFVVEAVMYGFFAALLATGLGYLGLFSFQKPIADKGIAVKGLIDTLTILSPFVLLGMILLGSLIGVISARLAVRRHLKV
jgi:cell division transport system permease protein